MILFVLVFCALLGINLDCNSGWPCPLAKATLSFHGKNAAERPRDKSGATFVLTLPGHGIPRVQNAPAVLMSPMTLGARGPGRGGQRAGGGGLLGRP